MARRHLRGPRAPFLLLCLVLLFLAQSGRIDAEPVDLQIHWIEPAWVPASTGGTIEVSGLGFDDSITASIDGVALPASSITVLGPTRLLLDLPASSARISDLELTRTIDSAPTQTATKYGGILYTGSTNWHVSPTGSDNNSGTSSSRPKATIAAAISAAMGTDTADPNPPAQIRVAEGTYAENLRLLKGTVLLGGYSPDFTQRDPDRFVSVIDGRRNNLSAVRTTGSTDNFCLMDGFTITNSRRTGAGAAFRSFVGAPTVTNNVLIGNVASRRGGGIYFRFADFVLNYKTSATIAKNLIVGNRARELSGGGVMLYAYYYTNQGDPEVAITDNLIVGNRAVLHGGGVAVGNSVYYTQDRLHVSVSHNRMEHNRAENGGALAIYPALSTQFFIDAHDNLLHSNAASRFGGGVFFTGSGGGELLVTSSTLVENTATEGGALYRAVPSRSSTQFTALVDDILWYNTGGDVADAEGLVAVHFTDSTDDLTPRGGGNFSLDPMFLPGPLGLLYLDPASPALDAGSDLAGVRALSERTTQIDQQPDAGALDLGFHFPVVATGSGATPQLLHLVPAFGDFQGGDWALLRGEGFEPGSRVLFDGVEAVNTLYVAPNRLLAQPPATPLAGAFTLVDVQVMNPGGVMSPQALPYRFVDAEPPEWDTTLGVISSDSPQESANSIIVRWNPAVDAVSEPVTYNVHRQRNVNLASQLIIPQVSNLIASELTGTSYIDTDFKNNETGTSWVYRVRAIDSAFFPNEEMTLVRVFGTALDGANPARPDPSVYLFRVPEAVPGSTFPMKVLVSNQGTATASSMTLAVTLPQDFVYDAGSTLWDGDLVSDDLQGTPFPLDDPGFTITDLPHSTSTLFTFEVRNDSPGGLLSWQGAVSTSDSEIRTDNNQRERFISSSALGPDLSINKSALVGMVSGGRLEYTLEVSAGSTAAPVTVTVLDALPAGVLYVAGSTQRDGLSLEDDLAGTPFPLDEAGFLLPDVAANSATRLQFAVDVDLSSGTIINQGSVAGPAADPEPADNTAQAATEVIASGTPLQPVGDTLRWVSGGVLEWDPAAGAALYFVHRTTAATDYAAGSAARLTPLGTLATSYLETVTPGVGQAFFYRVNAGDGMTETDELGAQP